MPDPALAAPTDVLLASLGTLADDIAEATAARERLYAQRAEVLRSLHARGVSLGQMAAAARVTRMAVHRVVTNPADSGG